MMSKIIQEGSVELVISRSPHRGQVYEDATECACTDELTCLYHLEEEVENAHELGYAEGRQDTRQ